jgi:hypothetical protein
LLPGRLALRWEASLTSAAAAALLANGRVLVQRAGGWSLFDREGKQIADDSAGRAAITLDPEAGQFYSLGLGNYLRAHAIEDGQLRFSVSLGYNEAFAWPLLYRIGNRLIAAATEQKMFAPKVYPPTRALIQITEVGTPIRLSPYKELLSVNAQRDLIFKNPRMLPLVAGNLIWAVLPNLLVRTSPSQEIAGAWSDSFEPILASADEAGWLYLIAGLGERRELWIITPEGHRTVRAELSPEYRELLGPPAIGYDHRVYLWTSQMVVAFSPEGKHLWNAALPGGIRALSVTSDGRLIVAAGRQIHVVDESGKSSQLLEVEEPATTAPVVTTQGDLVVGTATKLLYFSPKK